MKKKIIIVACLLATGFAVAYYYQMHYLASLKHPSGIVIRDFIFDKDYQSINNLFHKGDNWYWMISTESTDSYSMEHMLRYKTSSQKSRKHDMIMKVVEVEDRVAGFLAYYPKSQTVWQLLFLIVDQDFRRKGLARSMLDSAVHDMLRLGALRIDLATRNNNFRAQSLYSSYGFMLVDDQDDDFVHFSWYKIKP